MTTTPEQLHYTAEHEWIDGPTEAGTVRFGITDYAQDALGDIVYVSLPAPGEALVAGQTGGEVATPQSVSDVYAPVRGPVGARNAALDGNPELVNSDPYGDGWMVEVQLADGDRLDGLLDAVAYGELTAG